MIASIIVSGVFDHPRTLPQQPLVPANLLKHIHDRRPAKNVIPKRWPEYAHDRGLVVAAVVP